MADYKEGGILTISTLKEVKVLRVSLKFKEKDRLFCSRFLFFIVDKNNIP